MGPEQGCSITTAGNGPSPAGFISVPVRAIGSSPNFCDKELSNLTLRSLPAQAAMARTAMNNEAVIRLLLRMTTSVMVWPTWMLTLAMFVLKESLVQK